MNIVMKLPIILVVILCIAIGCTTSSYAENSSLNLCQGHKTPESVYLESVNAINSSNWELAYDCFVPDIREVLLKHTLTALIFASALDDNIMDLLTPVLKKHGFTLNDSGQWNNVEKDYKSVENYALLYGDLYALARTLSGKKSPLSPHLSGVVVKTNTARSKVKNVLFRKVSGSWYIDLDTK